jgi:drug/metabolite transporter (DMT)-like permease
MTAADRAELHAHHAPRAPVLAAFAAIYLVWGSTYLAIKYAVETVPPFFMTGARFLVAGVVLYGWSTLRGRGSGESAAQTAGTAGQQWRDAFIVGALLIVGGTALVGWAELSVPTGIASLVLATTPLWMVLLESAMESRRAPTMRVMMGVMVGLVGLAILIGPSLVTPHGDIDLLGVGGLLLSALTWSIGAIYSRRALVPASPARATGMQMIAGALLSLVAGFALGEHNRLVLASISPASMLAVAYLVIAGALVGFSAYLWLMRVSTPSRVATHAYVNPVVAVLLGWAILDESVTMRTAIAMGVIVLAVVLIVSAPTATRRARSRAMLSFRHGELAERRS